MVLDSKEMNRAEYQEYMDGLSMRVSKALEGARVEDAISACAACIGFGMVHILPENRDQMREHMARIIDTILEKAAVR